MDQDRQSKPGVRASARKNAENASENAGSAAAPKQLGSIKTETSSNGRLGSVNDDSKKTRGGASKVCSIKAFRITDCRSIDKVPYR
jgi:hypothetical protein